MSMVIYSLTTGGGQLASKLARQINATAYLKRASSELATNETVFDCPLKTLVTKHFKHYDCLVFIMATGIVVRTIAPLLQSKVSDPAIIVIDELGHYVISLLSGHLGGANQYAIEIANLLGAQPVITTATDLNKTMAFDLFAKQNNLRIANIEQLMYISQAMIDRQPVALYTSQPVQGDWPENILPVVNANALIKNRLSVLISEHTANPDASSSHQLHLVPQTLVVGIGCRKATPYQAIAQALNTVLKKHQLDRRAILRISTVDIKRDEAGIVQLCKTNNWPLAIISRAEIAEIQNDFSGSDFVEKTIGVRAVAEPCATISGKCGKLIVNKTKCNGITIAIFKVTQKLEL